MRICDLPIEKIVVGLRFKSLVDSSKFATIVSIDRNDDNYALAQWDGDSSPTSGFYGNDCKCEVVENKEVF